MDNQKNVQENFIVAILVWFWPVQIGLNMKEKAFNFGEKYGLAGILCEPEENQQKKPAILMLNSGLIYRAGPNRAYVKLSRSLAEEGYISFRYDFSGIGDSLVAENNCSFEENGIDETCQAIDQIAPKDRVDGIVLFGICSGADIAFKTALVNENVTGLVLVNGTYLNNKEKLRMAPVASRNTTIRYYKKNIFSFTRWKKIVTGKSRVINKSNIKGLIRIVFGRVKRKSGEKLLHQPPINSGSEQLNNWRKLLDRGVEIFEIYSEGSQSYDYYRMADYKSLRKSKEGYQWKTKILKDVDHTFTPVWSHYELIESVKSWLKFVYRTH